MNLAKVWASILQLLRSKVSVERFEVWLQDTRLEEMGEDGLVVTVPNKFAKDYIQSRLGDVIEDCIGEATGQRRRLTLRISTKQQKKCEPISKALDEAVPHIVPNPARTTGLLSPLRRDMTFDSFVVGKCNRLPHAAAWTFAEGEESYSPYFVYGKTGLGKTHLLQAVCHALADRNPDLKIVYINCPIFVSEFCSNVAGRTWDSFTQRYRDLDVLAIDDIHDLSSKKGTQREFLTIYNELDIRHKQVLLSSDVHPREIPNLDEAVRSRFLSGIVTRVDVPDDATKLNILKRSLGALLNRVPMPLLENIALAFTGSIRELRGLSRILAMEVRYCKGPVDEALMERALSGFALRFSGEVGVEQIEEAVCRAFKITSEQIRSRSQSRVVARARQAAMYLARKNLKMSYKEVGDYFGGKNHSTVILAEKKVKERLDKEDETQVIIRGVCQQLNLKS